MVCDGRGDRCTLIVHQSCYGGFKVPKRDWVCLFCTYVKYKAPVPVEA